MLLALTGAIRSFTPWCSHSDIDKQTHCHVTGGMERWHDLYHGKRSAEVLDALITEMNTVNDKGPETLDALGEAEDVPK